MDQAGGVRTISPEDVGAPLLDEAFQQLHDAVLLVSWPERRILDANPALLRLLRCERRDLLGRPTRDIHTDEARYVAFGEQVRAISTTGGTTEFEFALRRPDGTSFPASIAVSPAAKGRALLGLVRDLTEAKRAETARAEAEAHRARVEEELRRTTRNLQDFVETSAMGLHWVGPDGTIMWANPADHEMLGYAREEYVGRNIREFHADHDVIDDILARLSRDEKLRDYPARLKAKDGSIRHVLIDSSVLWEEGKFAHTRCFTRDVTRHRELEARERENAERVRTLVRVQEDLARTLELENVVQVATDASTMLTGAQFGAFFYNVTDQQGQRYTLYTLSGVPREAFAGFPMPRNTAIFAPTFNGERIVRSDDITKDPSYGKNAPHAGMPKGHLPVRSYLAAPVVSRDGIVHGGIFLGHPEPGRFGREAEDVLAALAAQTATAIDNANLYRRARESEELYRSLVTHVPDQIVTVNGKGEIVAMNRGLGGERPEKLIGKRIHELASDADRERIRAVVARVMETGEPTDYETTTTLGGQERWLHVRVAPMSQSGEPGAILITTDITPRKRTEIEVSRMRAQVMQGEKLAALGSLVSGVAHELRTPLTFLSNNTFLLKRRLDDASRRGLSAADASEGTQRLFADITDGVDRINQLVEDLRRYTKARSDSDHTEQAMHEMIVDAIELFRATSRRSHVIETSLSPTRPIRANKGALQQVTLNLLLNAADATPSGGKLRVSTRDEGDSVVLEVADEGPGIPEDVMSRMYEPLYTTKPGGTGLGLSIVRRIVEEHHGSIACESTPGRGATFRVRFPVPETADAPA